MARGPVTGRKDIVSEIFATAEQPAPNSTACSLPERSHTPLPILPLIKEPTVTHDQAHAPPHNPKTLAAIYAGKADTWPRFSADVVAADLAAIARLPEGFTPVTADTPANDRPVIAIRRSGYTCSDFEILTARHMPDYRPHSPWRDLSGDAVGDTGNQILGWRYADELLRFS